MRARLKTEIWDVWQYARADAARPLWVLNCTVLNDGDLHMLVEGLVDNRIAIGDWLVRDGSNYGPSHMPDETFQRDYELVP